MAGRIVGVDIGETSIRAVELDGAHKAKPTLTRYHEVALPEGAARSGEVIEVNTVASALKRLWSTGGFRSRKVVIGMANQKILARDITVAKQPLPRIRETLPFQVQDLLPVPVADALLDFYPIAELQTENGPVLNGLLIAAVKDAVMANVNAVRAAGLTPVNVDLVPFALRRSLAATMGRTGTVALIAVGSSTTNVLIAKDGIPQFVRMIPTGGADVTRAIVSRLELTESEAEGLKRTIGMATGAVAPEHRDAVEVIYEIARELLLSLRNTINYYSNTHADAPVGKIVLTGGGAQLPGFSAAIAEVTALQVVEGSPIDAVTLSKDFQKKSASINHHDAAVALGLALGARA